MTDFVPADTCPLLIVGGHIAASATGMPVLSRIFGSLRRSASLKTFAVVMVFAAGAKAIGLVKEMAVAAGYGAGPSIDAYLYTFNLASAPVSIWFGTIFAVIVPHLIRLDREAHGEAAEFRGQMLSLSTISGLIVGLAVAAVLAWAITSGRSGLTADVGTQALGALAWLWLMIPLLFVAQFGASCLMARNRHANSLYEGAPALVILAAVLLFPATVETLAVGTLLGAVLQLVATWTSAARAGGLARVRMPRFRGPAWAGLWSALGFMAIVQLLQSAVPVVDQLLAAQMPTGSLARFGYALRTVGILLTLVALAVPRVLLPALSVRVHQADRGTDRFVGKWAVLLGGIGVAAAAAVSIVAEPLVRLLYQRGSFTPADTAEVAVLLAVMIWQLPFYMLAMLFTQHRIASRNYSVLIAVAAATLAVKLAAGLILARSFGLVGLAASAPIVFAFQTIALALFRRGTEAKLEDASTHPGTPDARHPLPAGDFDPDPNGTPFGPRP